MKNAQPKFDTTTHYRIELRGRVDVEWLKSFDENAEINVYQTRQDDTEISGHLRWRESD